MGLTPVTRYVPQDHQHRDLTQIRELVPFLFFARSPQIDLTSLTEGSSCVDRRTELLETILERAAVLGAAEKAASDALTARLAAEQQAVANAVRAAMPRG